MENSLRTRAKEFFAITPSDSALISADENNTKQISSVFLKNNTDAALNVKVDTAGGSTGVVYIPAGYIEPLEVVKVYSTGGDTLAEGDLLGYY